MVSRKSSPVLKGRKFKQVLDGARKVFLRDGYAGASVDDIAGEAKVSKATLYSYFPDKELMFSEVFRAELERDADEPLLAISADRPAAEVLPQVVQTLAMRMVSAPGVQFFRMRVAESARFPDLAREYHDSSNRRHRDEVRHYLERWVRRGELEIDDLELAAEQLIALSSVLIRDRAVLLGSDSVTDVQVRRSVMSASQVFMAAYAPRYVSSTGVHNGAGLRHQDRAKTVPPME